MEMAPPVVVQESISAEAAALTREILGHDDEATPEQLWMEKVAAQEAVVAAEGQSAADPTVELTQESLSETVSTAIVEETVSVTDQSPPQDGLSQSTTDTTAEAIVQEIGEEFVSEISADARILIETCEAAVVGPPEAVAAATVAPSTALAVVKQEETAVVKKPVISARMLKTWGRSVKDSDRKANLLLPGVHPDFAGDLVITKLVDNPKLPGKSPWLRFAKYRNGMTVAEYVKACERLTTTAKVSQADLKWDVNHGYIRVTVAAEAPKAIEQAA